MIEAIETRFNELYERSQDKVISYFKEKYQEDYEVIKVNKGILYLPIKAYKTSFCFTIHTDRIPLPNTPQLKRETKARKEFLVGQLDNFITLSIFDVILDEYPTKYVPFLLTDEEECGRSWRALKQVISTYNLFPISLDIDILSVQDMNLLEGITVPRSDLVGDFDPLMSSLLRTYARENDIVLNDNCWTMVETGFLNRNDRLLFGAHIGLPIINYHTDHETASVNSILQFYRFLKLLIHKIEEE